MTASALARVQGRDYIPNDICPPNFETKLFHQFSTENDVDAITLDSRWQPRTSRSEICRGGISQSIVNSGYRTDLFTVAYVGAVEDSERSTSEDYIFVQGEPHRVEGDEDMKLKE